MKKKGEAFLRKWEMESHNWHNILDQLEKASPSTETINKKQEILQLIKRVEGALS
jgi:tRNA (adenine22-N1)-methyltransferase